jgi:hypothetical protein
MQEIPTRQGRFWGVVRRRRRRRIMEQAANIKFTGIIAGNDADAVGTDSFDGAAGGAKDTADGFPLTWARFAGTNAKGFMRWIRWDAYASGWSGDAGDTICGPESQTGS